ncbi:MAG: disulfide oxidoreductase [Patescibacteria group bacterium]
MSTQQVTQFLSLLTVAAQVFAGVILILFLFRGKKWLSRILKYSLKLAFLVSLAATLGSLYYSDVAGFEPCKLCWYQRIFMYPQPFLYGLALLKKDKRIVDYGILLSVIGAIIAGYHYLLQVGVVPSLACEAVGYSASCSKRFVMTFGYITIPMMALSAFLLITGLLLVLKYSSQRVGKK